MLSTAEEAPLQTPDMLTNHSRTSTKLCTEISASESYLQAHKVRRNQQYIVHPVKQSQASVLIVPLVYITGTRFVLAMLHA